MKQFATLALLALMSLPAFAATQTFKDASVVDVKCSKKAAANPDAHTRACALGCQKSGFGIITSGNRFLKFDSNGNQEISRALEASSKKDHLRVDVTGDVEGDTPKVASVKLL